MLYNHTTTPHTHTHPTTVAKRFIVKLFQPYSAVGYKLLLLRIECNDLFIELYNKGTSQELSTIDMLLRYAINDNNTAGFDKSTVQLK